MPNLRLKFDEKHVDYVRGLVPPAGLELCMPKFFAKIEPRFAKIGSTSILSIKSNSQVSKTSLTAVSFKSKESDEMAGKKSAELVRVF